MSSFAFSDHDARANAVRLALLRGNAEDVAAEQRFVLRYLDARRALTPLEWEDIIDQLSSGVSPYHVFGEYEVPGSLSPLSVPRGVMPPGCDTAGIVRDLQAFVQSAPPRTLADVGCGTGILGIAAMLAAPLAEGVFVDIDPLACATAQSNLKRARLSGRARVICDGSLRALSTGSVQLLIANLPFVPAGAISMLPPRFSRFAPRVAVDGGADGLDVFRQLLPAMQSVVTAAGHMALQVGDGQDHAVLGLLGKGWTRCTRTVGQRPHLLMAHRSGDWCDGRTHSDSLEPLGQ